jgi:hypothetical protein
MARANRHRARANRHLGAYELCRPFILDKIKKIYNKDASLFLIHLKKKIHLPWSKLGEFQDYLEVQYIDSARAKT